MNLTFKCNTYIINNIIGFICSVRYIELSESKVIELIKRNKYSNNKTKNILLPLLPDKQQQTTDRKKPKAFRSTINLLFDNWVKHQYGSLRIKSDRDPKHKSSKVKFDMSHTFSSQRILKYW